MVSPLSWIKTTEGGDKRNAQNGSSVESSYCTILNASMALPATSIYIMTTPVSWNESTEDYFGNSSITIM